MLGACKRYSDLVQVRRDFKCSAAWLCSTLYEQLELERRKRLYPWQWKVGIDEHFFRRGKQGFRGFVTVIVDQKSHRLMEVIEGRTGGELRAALESIPGRENVRIVTIDMSDPYRSLVRGFFPNAVIVADKFHVLRLLSPQPPRQRHHRRQAHQPHPPPLAPQGRDLDPTSRWALRAWLTKHPVLRALHEAKERLSNFYRIRRHEQADRGLTAFTDSLALSHIPELQTLRGTLMKWRKEILAHFLTRATNGMTEGFNGKAKLVKRRAYGCRSFRNYRLRLLNACA